jgi:hypothetical protein
MATNSKVLTNFIKARYAEWAGDISYCQELLQDITDRRSLERVKSQQRAIESPRLGKARTTLAPYSHPLELIQHAGLQVKEYADALVKADEASPTVTTTEHLRGVVWEVSSHEFEFRAYLRDLSWESMLYKNAALAAEKYGGIPFIYKEEGPGQRKEQIENHSRREGSGKIGGATWILDEGNFFREVTVSYLALTKVRGIWARRELPEDKEPIVNGFREVLTLLEGQI